MATFKRVATPSLRTTDISKETIIKQLFCVELLDYTNYEDLFKLDSPFSSGALYSARLPALTLSKGPVW